MLNLKNLLDPRPIKWTPEESHAKVEGDTGAEKFLVVSLTEVYLCPKCEKPIHKEWLDKPQGSVLLKTRALARCKAHGALTKVIVERYESRTQFPSCDWPWRDSYLAATFPHDERTVQVGGETVHEEPEIASKSKRKLQVRK